MLALCAIVLLCLTSRIRSVPLACENLVRPLDQLDPHHLEGKRAMVAGSLSYLPLMERLRRRDSATITFTSDTAESTMLFSLSSHVDNTCHYPSYNITLEGSRFTYYNGNVTTTFIHTSCHDCILMSSDVESGKRQHFYLFSRRRQLEQKEVNEFRDQVECLNMPPPVVMDPTKELCPEETTSSPATETEEKSVED